MFPLKWGGSFWHHDIRDTKVCATGGMCRDKVKLAVWINPHRTVSENQAILEAWNFTFQLLQYLSHILASWHWYILIAFFTTWGQATLEDKLRKPIDFPRPCLKVLDFPIWETKPIQEASSPWFAHPSGRYRRLFWDERNASWRRRMRTCYLCAW